MWPMILNLIHFVSGVVSSRGVATVGVVCQYSGLKDNAGPPQVPGPT